MRRAVADPGARFIDPTALARIGNLELIARTVVDGFVAGLHRSPYLGLSLDFAEYRAYMPGDDVRRVDWRLYARTDRYYVKEYEAETNADFMAVLDVSRSMGYGSGGITKLDYARYLAATLACFSHRQRDRVGLIAFDDEVVERVPASARNYEVVLDPAEIELPFDRAATFRDLESGEAIPVIPTELRAQYRALVEAHTASLARLFAAEGIDYTLVSTASPLDHVLFGYLAARQKLMRVR